ncbi:uncharacterized protein LOC118404429 [Branchiostoma floridae]|uniref:Uncharacterized protein LOC118404429 n=1 Tax=Branchiostoma floridae TaxID=7739 RepID=A0A9J7HGU3_BRAFL|nr:uncharacterized protein LOC118404429 [Branchiostoma floridae]
MDPLHRQALQDCYDDIARDMDPGLALRYSTVRWRDGDPGFIRAKTRAEGLHSGARALLDRLMDLPYDGFDDFVQSLKEVPYDHLVQQLLKTRERLKNAVVRGEIRRRDLGRRPEVNMEDYFDKVIKNVSYKWYDLARKVGFKRGEIEAIRATESLQGPDKKCREVLERWLERNGTNATLQVLQQALIDIEERHTAEELHVWTEKAQHSLQTTGQEMKTTGKETMEKVDGLGVEQYPAAKGTGQSVKDVTRWITNRARALAILVTCFVICTWMCMLYCGSRTHEPVFLAAFPRRLKSFVGREDVFSRIDACLQENQTCLIKGLGGVGKTSVAIEYGHRRAERYPGGVFWVRLASKGDLCASISQYSSYISDSLQLKDDLSCKNMKMHFRRYLTSSHDWILVVDEAVRNTTGELESLLPHTLKANMNVLLTSNEYQRLGNERIPVVNLPPFSETEAQAMFNKMVRPSIEKERTEIKLLSRSLGHHPLALQFAFAYIEETGCSVKEYHDKYTGGNATEKVDLLDESGVEQVSSKKIRRVFDITFQYLSQLSSNAAKLLDVTSFMGPDCIPCPKYDSKGFRRLFNTSGKLDKLDTKKMVSVLEKFSLASPCHAFQPCAFSVNRIVQEVVVAHMNESTRVTHLENAMKYSTLLLKHSNDTKRIQAEFLMAHVHYLALNIDRYQLNVSVTGSSSFLNKSAEFFSRWGACEEAYFFLHAEILLLFKHNVTEDLCFHLHDHVKFLNTTLLPCLFNGDVPVELLVDIADNLYWEAKELTIMQPSSSEAASYSYTKT